MSRYIPMPAYPDMMPVDISFVFEREKPAGKHGFVRTDGHDLRFEDGTLARFWGVNFNGGACFPSKEYARQVAGRLAQAGCNIVRFHQLDAEWDTPNLFSYSKGKRVTSTRELDRRSLDRLDYLVFALKNEGIYCYLDMLTYRKFKEEDGVAFHKDLLDAGKPWSMIDPRMIELQKEYATQLWNHVNPYTGLAYKDDPVFVLTEITNENDLFLDSPGKKVDFVKIPYYEGMFRGLFRDWLREQNLEYDWEYCDLYAPDEPLLRFKIDITKKYFREMRDHLRSLGVKIPIAGTNWAHGPGCAKSHEEMDFTDNHWYFYDWKWGNTERICTHRSITSTEKVSGLTGQRHPNKPMFISEWDMPWPNAFRAEGPIWFAAMGALQNLSGFTIHTYSYSTRLDKMDVLGKELNGAVGGVPYREGIFSTWNDPAKFGLFYHAALLFRRGDVSPAKQKVAFKVTDYSKSNYQAAISGLERHQMAITFDDELPQGYDRLVLDTDLVCQEEEGKLISDTGQLWRNIKRQIGAVDTERTKIVYGFIGKGGSAASTQRRKPVFIDLDGMRVDSRTDFAVVALSSLTDAPIEESDNLLLSAIGRARNTGAQFDGDKMLDVGHAPIMAEVVEAEVQIRTKLGDSLKVWGVNAEGFYCGKLPTTYENGILSFYIGDQANPACYYLIVKE
ncbi:MAG: hypothetical protein E7437_03360 [Ruminococcaceae bacterium]|nr:hypothetical protein [Oscillospiraceae bacterium]